MNESNPSNNDEFITAQDVVLFSSISLTIGVLTLIIWIFVNKCEPPAKRDTHRPIQLQEGVEEIYSFVQQIVNRRDFKELIQKDAFQLDDLEEELKLRKEDLMKTECPVVFAGETSSGKSSIINLLLGHMILPSDIEASTSRVCRVKYSEKLTITTRNEKDEELKSMTFKNTHDMAMALEVLAKTGDPVIRYVDIMVPTAFIKGNVIVVDTPGFGDKKQENVAQLMLEYLPNALAIVFVINVQSAGGIQDDRLLKITNHARNVMKQMFCFDPKDVIFVLNKWDSLSEESYKKQKFYESSKTKIHNIWTDVNDARIVSLSATKASNDKECAKMFESFRRKLEEVITKNENKRTRIHIEFLKTILGECQRIVLTKLNIANHSKQENRTRLDQLTRDANNLERIREEATSNITSSIEPFFGEVAKQLHAYMNGNTFKRSILLDIKEIPKQKIKMEIDSRIEGETLQWQLQNMERIFKEEIIDNLTQRCLILTTGLHAIKDKMMGLKNTPGTQDKIMKTVVSIIPIGSAVVGTVLKGSGPPNVVNFVVITAAGLVGGMLLKVLNVFDDLDTFIEQAFHEKMSALDEDKIKKQLQAKHAESILSIIKKIFDVEFKLKIDNIKDNLTKMKHEQELYMSEANTLQLLSQTISTSFERLDNLEIYASA